MENELQTKTTGQSGARTKAAPFFLPVQPKLSINQPNDVYEQEADAMADKVMRMNNENANPAFFKPAGIVQRKCKHCEEEDKLHRKETSSQSNTVSSSTESYISNLSGGKTLTESERNFFEPRMGYDFSDVRVHTGSSASQSAKDINALAYTHGNNIVFAPNQYQPETNTGKHLMAHELTHVIQQSGNINRKNIVQRSEQCDEEGNCIFVDDGIDASFVVPPSLPGNETSSATSESGGGSTISYGAASTPVLGSTIAKSVANSLRSSARSGAVEDLVESVESGTYSQQSLYTAERLTPDQLVEIAENGTAPELEFSHLESLSSAPQYGGESELGVLTDEADHLYGHHGGNYSNDPGEFADPDWETRPESEELFGDSNMQIADAETEEGMEYLGLTDSPEIATDTAVDVGTDIATDVGTDVAADVATDVAADALIDAGATLSAEELLPLLLLLL